MADDLGRSCGRRLNTPQMCQLNSTSSCEIRMGLPLRLAVKSSPRLKTLRKPRIRFLVGRIGAEKGEGNIGLRKEGDTLDDGGRLAAPRVPPRSN
jgi:hypothetical protein